MMLFLHRAIKISRVSEDRSSLRSVHVHLIDASRERGLESARSVRMWVILEKVPGDGEAVERFPVIARRRKLRRF